MLHVIAIITAKPGQREKILEAFRANMPAVHAVDGCIERGPATVACIRCSNRAGLLFQPPRMRAARTSRRRSEGFYCRLLYLMTANDKSSAP
jgi:hypothetical protein